jgi:hypothetical protein
MRAAFAIGDKQKSAPPLLPLHRRTIKAALSEEQLDDANLAPR